MIENVMEEPGNAPSIVFAVERTLSGLSLVHLAAAHRALGETARRLSGSGDVVRYLRCTYRPGAERCLCVFEANDVDLVRRVNQVAQVPFDRIEEAIDFQEPGGSSERSTRR